MRELCSRTPYETLLVSEGDAPFGQIVWGHLDVNTITCKHPNAMLTHLSRRMGENLVIIIKFHPKMAMPIRSIFLGLNAFPR